MAGEESNVAAFGADITGVLTSLEKMKAEFKAAKQDVGLSVASITRTINELTKTKDLDSAFAVLNKGGKSSPYIQDKIAELRAVAAEAKLAEEALKRLQRVTATGRPTAGPTPYPTPSPATAGIRNLSNYTSQTPGYVGGTTAIGAALARANTVANNPAGGRSSAQVSADRRLLAEAEQEIALREQLRSILAADNAAIREKYVADQRSGILAQLRNEQEARLDAEANAAQIKLIEARQAAAAAQKRQVAENSAAALRGNGGILGGGGGGAGEPPTFGGNFYQGFAGAHGGGTAGLGFTLGQAAKFGLIYGSMYRVLEETSRLFKDAFEQTVAYQKSVAELRFQTGQSADAAGSLATQLQRAATTYGESGSAGIEAGQKALGVYGATDKSQAVQDATAVTAAKIVTQLAYVTGKPVDALVEGLGALTKAFGEGAESISSAADIAVKFGQLYHINAADLIAAAPKLAPLAQTVGFSEKEAIALEAAAAARSGQTASQTVSNLDTLLAKGLSGPLIAEMAKLGIDPTKSVREQIFGNPKDDAQKSLAGLFNSNPSLRDEILGAAGRGGSNRDFVASTLEAAPEALKNANATVTEGALDSLTGLIQNTLGGAIRTLSGDAKNLSIELGKSGLFDVVGLLIVGLDGLLKGVNGVLGVFELFPRPIRDAAIALGLLAAAAKVGALSGLVSRGGGAFASGAVSNIGTRELGRIAEDGTIIAGSRAATSATGTGSKIAAAGRGALTFATADIASAALIGTGVGAVVLAAGLAKNAYDKHAQAVEDATHAMILNRDANLNSADTANAAADSLAKAADEARKGNGRYGVPGLGSYFGGHLDFGVNTDIGGAALRGNILDTSAALDRSIGARNQAKSQGLVANTGAFGDFSADTLTTAFAQLKTSGFSAAEILRQFNSALDENGKVTEKAKAQQFDYANQAKAVYNTINSQATTDLGDAGLGSKTGVLLNNILGPDTISKFAASAKAKGLTDSNLTSGAAFSTLAPIFDENGAKAVASGLISQKDLDTLKSQFLGVIAAQLAEDAAKRAKGSQVNVVRTVNDAIVQAGLEASAYTDNLTSLNPGDSKGANALLAGHISDLQRDIHLGLADTSDPDAAKKLAGLEQQLRDLLLDKAKQDIQAAKDAFGASSKNLTGNALTLAGAALNTANLNTAIQGGDTEDLTKLLTNASQSVLDSALQTAQNLYQIEAQNSTTTDQLALAKSKLDATTQGINAAKAASDSKLQISAAGQTSAAQLTYSPVDDAKASITAAQAALQKYQTDNPGVTQSAELTTLYGNLAITTRQAGIAAKQYATDILTSQNDLRAARTGGALAQAGAAVANAQAEVSRTTGDIVAHTQALTQLASAQQQQRDALLSYAASQRQLGIDVTNPVAEAAAAVADATAKLKSDQRAGAGKDIISQDKVGLQSANNSAQKAKFDQYNGDLQTSLDLGKITQSSFLNSVDAEINDLTQKRSLLKKTDNMYRQYTDEINDLAKTKKSLQDSLDSQFNLGSIQVPTVYQARQYAQNFLNPAGGSAPGGNSVQVTIYANSSQDIQDALHNAFGGGNGYANVVY